VVLVGAVVLVLVGDPIMDLLLVVRLLKVEPLMVIMISLPKPTLKN